MLNGVYPFFWKNGNHKSDEYLKVLASADFFRVERLVMWLKEKKYLQIVKEKYEWREVEGMRDLNNLTLDGMRRDCGETHF